MAWIISWQFMGWPASPSTLAAASRALSLLDSALGFPFLAATPGAWARLAAGFWVTSGLPFVALASLAALFLVVFAVVLDFFALMVQSPKRMQMGWLPSSGGGNHPPRRPRGRFG